MSQRKIIHIDMDAFFASVEQRDKPELCGKPVIVGGQPQSRGVVAACSYEARQFGIHSAMPSSQAYRRCPQAIFIKPRFDAYRAVSEITRSIFRQYTQLVEPVSIDEAYLDVSESTLFDGSATLIAQQIKKDIQSSVNLTASAGVSHNKFLAKLASDMDKPDGIYVIRPGQEHAILEGLNIRKFHGIGKATEAKMQAMGIYNGRDLKQCDKARLMQRFGKAGNYYFNIARGIDERPVRSHRTRKSVGVERTLQEDLLDTNIIEKKLATLTHTAFDRLTEKGLCAKTLTLKIKYADFELITRSHSFTTNLTAHDTLQQLPLLIEKTEIGRRPVRLLGVSFSNLSPYNHSPSDTADAECRQNKKSRPYELSDSQLSLI